MKHKSVFLIILGFTMAACGLFKSPEQLFSEAEEKRNAGEIKEAILVLDKIVSKYPDHPKAEESQYLIGEIYYRDLRDFAKAIENYKKFQAQFTQSEKVPLSLFMQGFIYANRLSNFERAKQLYGDFLESYPNHELAPSVQFELDYLGRDIDEIPALKHLNS